jgi:hypothetical protein
LTERGGDVFNVTALREQRLKESRVRVANMMGFAVVRFMLSHDGSPEGKAGAQKGMLEFHDARFVKPTNPTTIEGIFRRTSKALSVFQRCVSRNGRGVGTTREADTPSSARTFQVSIAAAARGFEPDGLRVSASHQQQIYTDLIM